MLTIYGSSDDLIEIEGDIEEEFGATGDSDLIALSNGCIFRIVYDTDGIWRITPVVVRAGTDYQIWQSTGPSADDVDYSDRLTINSEVTWVAHAVRYVT